MGKRKGSSGGGSSKSPGKHRSAETGRYVTPGYATKHPKTTVKESK